MQKSSVSKGTYAVECVIGVWLLGIFKAELSIFFFHTVCMWLIFIKIFPYILIFHHSLSCCENVFHTLHIFFYNHLSQVSFFPSLMVYPLLNTIFYTLYFSFLLDVLPQLFLICSTKVIFTILELYCCMYSFITITSSFK